MEDPGVISPVTEPTTWCSGRLVVPKKNGAVRLCIDYTNWNKHVSQERMILLTVDEPLAQLTNAKVFTELTQSMAFGKYL